MKKQVMIKWDRETNELDVFRKVGDESKGKSLLHTAVMQEAIDFASEFVDGETTRMCLSYMSGPLDDDYYAVKDCWDMAMFGRVFLRL